MNYYEIYDRYSGELLTRGNAAECRKALGCASLDSFYALANRARRGINKKYRVVIKKAGRWTTPCSVRMTRFTRRRDSKWQN